MTCGMPKMQPRISASNQKLIRRSIQKTGFSVPFEVNRVLAHGYMMLGVEELVRSSVSPEINPQAVVKQYLANHKEK